MTSGHFGILWGENFLIRGNFKQKIQNIRGKGGGGFSRSISEVIAEFVERTNDFGIPGKYIQNLPHMLICYLVLAGNHKHHL